MNPPYGAVLSLFAIEIIIIGLIAGRMQLPWPS